MKKNKPLFTLYILLSAVGILSFTSCKKGDKTSGPDTSLSGSVTAQLTKTDSLSTFTNFFKAAALTDAEISGGITILAPSNTAFGNAVAGTTAVLPDSSVLRDYIVKGILKSSDFTNGKTFTALSGKTLTVAVVADPIYLVNGSTINITPISTSGTWMIYGASQLFNAAPPLFFTIWDATKWTSSKPKGDPAAQATVSLYHTQAEYASNVKPAYTAQADNDGVAIVNGVIPGQYYVAAVKGTVTNVFSVYSELQNNTYIGYAPDTVLDNSGNFVWKDVNGDGKIDAKDMTAQPSLSVQSAKGMTSNTTILLGNYYKPLQTSDDAQAKLNTVYSGLPGAYGNLVVIDGTLSDDAGCVTGSGGISYCPFDNFTMTPILTPLNTIWSNAYFGGINALNYVLRDVPNMSIDVSLKADLIAQAKGLRAFIYLELLTYFGDIPVFNDLGSSFYPGISRTAANDVYTLIVGDLTAAAADLPATRTDGKLSLTKNAALGLLAKAALWKKDYPTVLANTTAIINSGSYSLAPSGYSWLTDAATSETIWAPSFSNIGAVYPFFYTGAFGSVTVQLCPVLRYGQVLLMDAEAAIGTGNLTKAAQDLNFIRTRSSLSTFSPFSGSVDATSALQTTWQTENYRQGDRFANLVRWGTAQSVLSGNGYHSNFNNVLPIPMPFLISYIDIVQNAGY